MLEEVTVAAVEVEVVVEVSRSVASAITTRRSADLSSAQLVALFVLQEAFKLSSARDATLNFRFGRLKVQLKTRASSREASSALCFTSAPFLQLESAGQDSCWPLGIIM